MSWLSSLVGSIFDSDRGNDRGSVQFGYKGDSDRVHHTEVYSGARFHHSFDEWLGKPGVITGSHLEDHEDHSKATWCDEHQTWHSNEDSSGGGSCGSDGSGGGSGGSGGGGGS